MNGALFVLAAILLILFVGFLFTEIRRIRPIFRWFDLWIGLYWDRVNRRLYIFPIPMVGLMVQFEPKF